MSDLPLRCRCGAFRAVVRGASEDAGSRVVCYCVDCRAFARHLGQEDRCTDSLGGTELYQTAPRRFDIEQDADELAVLRLSEKGLYRWYARCCDTPLCATLGTPKIAFVGILTANMEPPRDSLGPVSFRYKRDQALGRVEAGPGNLLRYGLRTLSRIVRPRLDGSWRRTPFFDAGTGRSVAEPRVLTDQERARAYREPERA